MRVNFSNSYNINILPCSFKGVKENTSSCENDYFSNTNTQKKPARLYINERLSSLKKQDGSNLIAPVFISIILRESEDIEGLSNMLAALKTDVLEQLNWNEFADMVYDKEPRYGNLEQNCAFLNSLNSDTLSKFANPSKLLFNQDFHFGELTNSLKKAQAANNAEIANIFTKAQKINDNEYKNVFRFCDKDGNLISKDTILFDSNQKILLREYETILNNNGQKQSIREISDYRNNKSHYINANISDISIKRLIPNFEVTSSGTSTICKYQSPVKGVSNVMEITKGEEPQNIVYAVQKDGGVHIRKKVTSFDGVTTIFNLDTSNNGSRKLHYKITDNDGKVLLDKNSSVEKISEKTYRTQVNGRQYLTSIQDDTLTIEDKEKGKLHKFNLDNYINKNDEDLKSFILTLEAPEIIRLFKNTAGVRETIWYQCHFNNFESFDILTDLNIFNLCHELGHAVDFSNGNVGHIGEQLSIKKEFIETHKKEYETFMQNATVTQRDYLRRSPRDNPLSEAFADANGLLNYYQSQEEVAVRTETFQQYFPRTIACVYNLINK